VEKPEAVLVDANAIIEAVRTGCWAAITGQLRVETVEECRAETLRGSPATHPGYVTVSADHLARLHRVHAVDDIVRARFKLTYAGADGMDPGEHDLLAYAHASARDAWVLCSPDKASVRAAVKLGLGDRLRSLEALVDAVGVRPSPPLLRQYTSAWLTSFRTKVVLEGL
jgi:hypothetical protein